VRPSRSVAVRPNSFSIARTRCIDRALVFRLTCRPLAPRPRGVFRVTTAIFYIFAYSRPASWAACALISFFALLPCGDFLFCSSDCLSAIRPLELRDGNARLCSFPSGSLAASSPCSRLTRSPPYLRSRSPRNGAGCVVFRETVGRMVLPPRVLC